jgi:hypothetical protein
MLVVFIGALSIADSVQRENIDWFPVRCCDEKVLKVLVTSCICYVGTEHGMLIALIMQMR